MLFVMNGYSLNCAVTSGIFMWNLSAKLD